MISSQCTNLNVNKQKKKLTLKLFRNIQIVPVYNEPFILVIPKSVDEPVSNRTFLRNNGGYGNAEGQEISSGQKRNDDLSWYAKCNTRT